MERKVALVAGATGVIGRGIVEHLAGLDDWEVVALSRTDAERTRGHSAGSDTGTPGVRAQRDRAALCSGGLCISRGV